MYPTALGKRGALEEKLDDLNLYAYAENDPVGRIDPLGLDAEKTRDKDKNKSIGCAMAGSYCTTHTMKGSTAPKAAPPSATPTREQVEAATNAAGSAGGVAALAQGEGLGVWKGENGKWNDEKWGGNQHTGSRKAALVGRGVLKAVGKFFGWVGVGQAAVDVSVDIAKGEPIGKSMTNLSVGAYSVLGGPQGVIIGTAYFVGDATGFNEALIESRKPIAEEQLKALQNGTWNSCDCF